ATISLGPISLGPTSLGTGERRVVCLVLARAEARALGDAGAEQVTRAATPALQAALAGFGARVDVLADGALLVTLEPGGAATDQAARAARAALALSALLPGGAVALVAGRAETGRRVPVGDVVDRGVALLALPGGRVRLDAVAAALVEVGFHVERDAAGQVLVAEHDVRGQARALLGRPTPYVGRDRELATLEGLFDEAESESSPRAALVVGAPGLGKSRLRQELVRRLTQRRDPPAVWLARADALQATAAFGLVAPMIRRALGVLDGAPIEGARERVRARVAASVEAAERERVTCFLGELARVPFPDDGYLPLATARRDRRVMADEMRNAFTDWTRGEARRPLVIVLEDMHAGDAPSVAFVDAALAELHDRPLFVVALARPEVHDVFPKLWAERHVQEVRLGPLARRAGEELARAVLGDRVSAEAVAHVVDLAAGNAFYLEELLRAVAEGARELPSTVLAMVEARIEGLDAAARRALRAASVFGGAAWPGAVAALLGPCGAHADAARDRAAARATLDDLTRREL
ncbi:MAG TPA: AAA family ATPase, partial [Byssovorax sp.]